MAGDKPYCVEDEDDRTPTLEGKVCIRCGMMQALNQFGVWAERARCLNCNRDYQRAYAKRFPEKRAAHLAIMLMLKYGEIVRPESCERCGKLSPTLKAHHEDYRKPKSVNWLCDKCHGERHREMRREGKLRSNGWKKPLIPAMILLNTPAKVWLPRCDCGQDGNPDLEVHARDCAGYVYGMKLRQKKGTR